MGLVSAAGHRLEDGSLVLWWDGIWTPGRFYSVRITTDTAHALQIRIEWDTATGRPSSYMRMEELLRYEDAATEGYLSPETLATLRQGDLFGDED